MEKIRQGESQKREDAGAQKGRKVAKHCVFPVFCGSGGSKGRLAKAAGAEVAGQMSDEKLHAVVAGSTFGSKKCQNTAGSAPVRVPCICLDCPSFAWIAPVVQHMCGRC